MTDARFEDTPIRQPGNGISAAGGVALAASLGAAAAVRRRRARS
jgi:hypothetical protein